MRRLVLLMLCFTLLIALPTSAQDNVTPLVQQVASAASLNFFGWSPDGTWIAYFTNDLEQVRTEMPPPSANMHLFNLETLQTCIYEDVPEPNSYDQRTLYTWLSGNRWLSLAHGIEIVTPCTEQTEDITASFPQPIYAINSLSADYTKALFEAENAYYLYDFATAAAHEVTGIVPNNIDGSSTLWLTTAWSPDGTQVAAVVNVYGSVY